MQPFEFQPRTRIIFGAGVITRLGELARELNFHKTLLVADRGLVASGHVAEAVTPLSEAGVEVVEFHDFDVNPDTQMIAAGRDFAAPLNIDSIIALGGGSSLDCAKGINFLLTNGGRMRDYPWLRQSHAAVAADDRHTDDGRNRKRSANLRVDLRRTRRTSNSLVAIRRRHFASRCSIRR